MLQFTQWRNRLCVLTAAASLGCSSSKTIAPDPEEVDADIARPSPGEPLLESIPGPMLGPFDSRSEALLAACRKIFTKPHSSAGRNPPPSALREEQEAFRLRRRVASEYCAWMYYTPDTKYEISLLTDQTPPDPTGEDKRCILPPSVQDHRYPPESIQYIVALHNHTFDRRISEKDILFIVNQGKAHGFEPKSKDGNPLLSVVAFFSTEHENPTCDGFYAYSPYTGKILKWTREGRRWSCTQTHIVQWLKRDSSDVPVAKEEQAPCPPMGVP
ncbi:MAG: hypothetical protein ACJ8AT_15050 [Hyalangium sp.]|uniref:hypothetical protein n=1 Tax=Hyalangium sp. TaxID=2028555 RepID=UPI00389AFBC1